MSYLFKRFFTNENVVDEEKLIDFIYNEWNGVFDKATIENILNSETDYLQEIGLIKDTF